MPSRSERLRTGSTLSWHAFWFVSAPLFTATPIGAASSRRRKRCSARTRYSLAQRSAAGKRDHAQSGIPFVAIRKTGWLWPPPPQPDLSKIAPQEAVTLRYRRALDTWLSEDLVADAVEALLDLEDEIGAPDAIVSDPFLSASAIAADIAGYAADHLRLARAGDAWMSRASFRCSAT